MSNEYEEMNVEKWVNLEDVAVHLSLSQDTVRTWIKEGKLPFAKQVRDISLKFPKLMSGLEQGNQGMTEKRCGIFYEANDAISN